MHPEWNWSQTMPPRMQRTKKLTDWKMQVYSVHYSKVLIHVHVLSCIFSCPINKTSQNGNCIHLLSFNTMCQTFRYNWYFLTMKSTLTFVSLIKLWISWTVFKFLHFLTINNYTSIRTDFFFKAGKSPI